MFERFTDRARKVMALANQEALRLNHEYIAPEHILLGLLKEGTGVGCAVLQRSGVDLKKVCSEVLKRVKAGSEMVTMGRLPQNLRAKKVIEYAIEEARRLNHNYVGTEHLLLGLIQEQESVAADVLKEMGVTLELARAKVSELLSPQDISEAQVPAAATELPNRRETAASSLTAQAGAAPVPVRWGTVAVEQAEAAMAGLPPGTFEMVMANILLKRAQRSLQPPVAH